MINYHTAFHKDFSIEARWGTGDTREDWLEVRHNCPVQPGQRVIFTNPLNGKQSPGTVIDINRRTQIGVTEYRALVKYDDKHVARETRVAYLTLDEPTPAVANLTAEPLPTYEQRLDELYAPAISEPAPRIAKTTTGPGLRDYLNNEGIPVAMATRTQGTNIYTVDFYTPGWEHAVLSAGDYAGMIDMLNTNMEVIDRRSIHAPWRDGNPIICATLKVEVL